MRLYSSTEGEDVALKVRFKPSPLFFSDPPRIEEIDVGYFEQITVNGERYDGDGEELVGRDAFIHGDLRGRIDIELQ